MKIYFLFDTKQHTGGGKNFLAALSQEFNKQGLIAHTISEADVVLFNSHHQPASVIWNRLVYPKKLFIHRVDGPMSVYTNRRDWRDMLARALNGWAADGTVWQSAWSRQANKWGEGKPAAVIHNAPSPAFFSASGKKLVPGARMKIMAHSWSSHPNKGLSDLQYLDKHLDFDRYQVDFWGPAISFTNIHQHLRASLPEIAQALREADVYIFTSRIEACSNALLEALASHTPVIAYDGSSNAELVQSGGKLYTKPEEIVGCLEEIRQHYREYVTGAHTPTINEIANQYRSFFESVVVPHHVLAWHWRTPRRLARVLHAMVMVRFEGIRHTVRKRQPLEKFLRALRLALFIQRGFRREFASLKIGDVAIDCGANIGDVTAQLAARGARVYAFEPHPQAFVKLQERFAGMLAVTCYNQAVGPVAGTQKLYLHQNSADDPIKWSVGSSFLAEKGNVNADEFVEVETVDLAAFILQLKTQVKLLKIDVEGAEYGILRRLIESGAIASIDSVLVETHEAKIPGLANEHADIVRRIKDKGLTNISLEWT